MERRLGGGGVGPEALILEVGGGEEPGGKWRALEVGGEPGQAPPGGRAVWAGGRPCEPGLGRPLGTAEKMAQTSCVIAVRGGAALRVRE